MHTSIWGSEDWWGQRSGRGMGRESSAGAPTGPCGSITAFRGHSRGARGRTSLDAPDFRPQSYEAN